MPALLELLAPGPVAGGCGVAELGVAGEGPGGAAEPDVEQLVAVGVPDDAQRGVNAMVAADVPVSRDGLKVGMPARYGEDLKRLRLHMERQGELRVVEASYASVVRVGDEVGDEERREPLRVIEQWRRVVEADFRVAFAAVLVISAERLEEDGSLVDLRLDDGAGMLAGVAGREEEIEGSFQCGSPSGIRALSRHCIDLTTVGQPDFTG